MKPSISAFFPAYNDAGTIPSMVIAADMTLRTVTDDYEVIVVDDGSSDHTGTVLEELARSYPRLRVVHHEKNRGYGGSLRTGFASATKELVFYTDGDAQYDPREMVLLLDAMASGVDVVNGYKMKRSDPLHRVVIGKLYHWTVKNAFGLKVRDTDCDFRLFRRTVFDKVHLERDSGVICVEMMKKVQDAGFNIAQVPVSHYHRAYGHSQFFNFRRVFRVGIDLMKLWRELVLEKRLGQKRAEAPTLQQEL
jgi:glycosyltransferase involved in cell wall biosynthesis